MRTRKTRRKRKARGALKISAKRSVLPSRCLSPESRATSVICSLSYFLPKSVNTHSLTLIRYLEGETNLFHLAWKVVWGQYNSLPIFCYCLLVLILMISGRTVSGVNYNATGNATGRRALHWTSKRCSVSKRHKFNDFVRIIVTSFIYKNVDR